jgi:hypothetical protein
VNDVCVIPSLMDDTNPSDLRSNDTVYPSASTTCVNNPVPSKVDWIAPNAFSA